MILEHTLAVLSEIRAIAEGSAIKVLRFGLDRLGGQDGGGLPVENCQPYGFRARSRDADTDADGNPTKGAGLLLFSFGGADEGGFPTQDPRVELVDEGKGGTQVYGWTGTKVPYLAFFGEGAAGGEANGLVRLHVPVGNSATTIEIDPSNGNVTITPATGAKIVLNGDTEAGGPGGIALTKYDPLAAAWQGLTTACAPKGITVPPLTGASTTKLKGT